MNSGIIYLLTRLLFNQKDFLFIARKGAIQPINYFLVASWVNLNRPFKV